MCDFKITLKEILARIPGLGSLFEATFGEKSELQLIWLSLSGRPDELVEMRIDVPEIFEDSNSLEKIIKRVREKYPSLQRWSFDSADKAWDNSVIHFRNRAPKENEFATENLLVDQDGRISLKHSIADADSDFRQLLDPVCGGFTDSHPSLVTPINDAYISDISLQYAGMFLLSSLVRYRPQIWVHAVSRFASNERPADDQVLALIEGFMDIVQKTYPKLVARFLTQS